MSDLVPGLIELRRDLHAHPELAWHEHRTTKVVADRLRGVGLDPHVLPGGTGLWCDVEGGGEGPSVALRADLDALPIADEKQVPYRSRVAGAAHACGHDVHAAVVLGAGLALARLAATGDVAGRVRLIFQPAEEVIPGGAMRALEAGVLDGVGHVFALHCDPRVDAGKVAVREGPITAATDQVTVRLHGPGGHTARPQLTADLVAALSDVLSRTPALLSRRVDPRAGLSLVWGRVSAGSAANVIPERGEAEGSIRVLDRQAWAEAADLVPELVRQVAGPYRVGVEVEYVQGIPPALNDPGDTELFRAVAHAALGTDGVELAPQSMGAEDFAWFLERVPGVLARLGVRRPGSPDAPDLHRSDFDVDESAIGCGVLVLVGTALTALRRSP
jgi:amidohydrolase